MILIADAPGRGQTGQDAGEVVAPRDLMEAFAIQGVDVHVEAAQAGIVERLRELFQQHAVGGEGQVLDARNGGQAADQHGQVAAHEGLAAGDAQLADSQAHGDAHEALDLFEIQNLAALHELHAGFRHAVEAADIAAVGDADAQVVVNAAEGIDEWSGVHHFTASMRSSGARARCITSADSSTRGSRLRRQSRSFSRVLSFMYGHSLQLQFSLAT